MPQATGTPGILALADRDRLRGLFAGAGFSEPDIDEVAFAWRFRDTDDYWAFLTGAAGAIESKVIASVLLVGLRLPARSSKLAL